MIDCRVVPIPLDIPELLSAAADPSSGAVSLFIGIARESSSRRAGEAVVRLDYEAYIPMAEREMQRIAQECMERYDIRHVLAYHRVGSLAIGDAAVAVVVSAPHRAPAFDGCRYMIEELKARAPIWKKELFHDGAEWVNAHP